MSCYRGKALILAACAVSSTHHVLWVETWPGECTQAVLARLCRGPEARRGDLQVCAYLSMRDPRLTPTRLSVNLSAWMRRGVRNGRQGFLKILSYPRRGTNETIAVLCAACRSPRCRSYSARPLASMPRPSTCKPDVSPSPPSTASGVFTPETIPHGPTLISTIRNGLCSAPMRLGANRAIRTMADSHGIASPSRCLRVVGTGRST